MLNLSGEQFVKYGRALLVAAMILFITGCTVTNKLIHRDPADLVKLENISKKVIEDSKKQQEQKIRLDALRDTAMSMGARAGLAWRIEQINASLLQREQYLDQVFNFRSLLLDDSVLPPVLVESKNSLNMETPQSIRVADTNYRIVKQARFITATPVWRDYLIMSATKPELPDPTLLPRDAEERAAWRQFTREGWDKGIAQANQIYVENLNRLKRDYQGMIRYRTLLAQNMVSSPLVAKRDLGITGGGEELSVNDRVFTIKALPALKADSRQWQPKITH